MRARDNVKFDESCKKVYQIQFNPRPDGPLDFPPHDGGGNLESPPPSLTRLLGHVAIRGKRHSEERQSHDETASVNS